MKKLVLIVMSVVMALGCFACFAACNKSETLVIGITDYEPMDYLDANGNWIGFDADLANEFGKEYGYTVKFQEIEWDNKVAELNSGAISVIWNGMTADDELGAQIDFSVAYATNMQCAVVKKTSTIKTVDDLQGATIAVERGSAANNVCNDELQLEDGNKNLTLALSQVKALLEVKSGTSDAALVDYTMAYSIVGKNDYDDLMIVDINSIAFNQEVFAVGVKKGNTELQNKLNEFFAKKYADGTLTTLAEKYSVALNDAALKELK